MPAKRQEQQQPQQAAAPARAVRRARRVEGAPAPTVDVAPPPPKPVARPAGKSKPETANVPAVRLPCWPEEVRGQSKSVAVTSLFTARNSKMPREKYVASKPLIVATIGENIYIELIGEEMRQDDEDVLLQLIHLARVHNLGEEFTFSGIAMIQALGWPKKGESYTRLQVILKRLHSNSLVFVEKYQEPGPDGKAMGEYGRRILEHFDHVRTGKKEDIWSVRLSRDFITLYRYVNYLTWEERKLLPPLARKLHSFYSSHTDPMDFSLPTLAAISGLTTQNKHKRKQIFTEAFLQLEAIGFLTFQFEKTEDGEDYKVKVRRRNRTTADQSPTEAKSEAAK